MEKVTVENIFSHVIHDNDTCEMVSSDCYMGIFTNSNHQGVNIVTSTLNEGKIIGFVNEFLSLIKVYYPASIGVYASIADRYNSMMLSIQHNTPLTIEDSCVFFIPTFANGTIHGYVAVYTFLEKYIQNIDTLGHRTIVMYKDAQKGINELFCTAFHNIFIERRTLPPRILYLDSNKIVHMKDIVFFRNHHHAFPHDLIKPLFFTSVFNSYILPDVPDISQVSSIAGKNTRNMCMMKTNESEINTTIGVFSYAYILQLCERYNFHNIEPSKIPTEKEIISLLQNAEICIFSAGSCFLKNIFYVKEEKVKLVHCIVHPDFNHFKTCNFGTWNGKIVYHYVSNTQSDIEFVFSLPQDFHPDVYKAIYPDLQGLDSSDACKHFITHGKSENRRYK
jgi:hypothetical protein